MNQFRPSTNLDTHHFSNGLPAWEWNVEVWVWMCIAIVVIAIYVHPGFVPVLDHDSFQYLSAAENALKGHLGYTSLIHFDAERSFGVMPAPMVTFPMGYPLAIALLSLAGFSLIHAALFLSAASTVACVPLLAWIAGQMGLSRVLRNVVIACFVFNAATMEFGGAVLSEAPFAFLVLLGVALMVAARLRADPVARWLWAGAGLAFGAAYFVRYAGLFFVVGLALLAGRHLLASRRSLATGYGVALGVACAAVLAGVTRNFLLVGNWRGRDEMLVNNPISSALVKTAQGFNALFLGSGTSASTPGGTFVFKALFCTLFLGGTAWLAWNHLRERPVRNASPRVLKGMDTDLSVLLASYIGCMLYAGVSSAISYGLPRNYVPITPLLTLALGLVLHTLLTPPQSSAARRLSVFALAASFCIYVFLNALVLRLPPRPDALSTAEIMDSKSTKGQSARSAVRDLVGERGIILANNGQAVGHVLGLPTVSLVPPTWSSVEWDERTIRETVRQFSAAAIVISAPIPGRTDGSDQLPSQFLRQLARGDAPSWLQLVYRSSEVLVYAPRQPQI